MECPYCGKPMEEGFLSSRSPVFWSEEVSGLPVGQLVLYSTWLGQASARDYEKSY